MFVFRVKLLMNRNSKRPIAMKKICLKNRPDALIAVTKETKIHYQLKHSSIIKYLGQLHNDEYYYIFLEYASGGDLFSHISKFIK